MSGILNLFFVMIWKKKLKRTDDHCIFFDLGSDWDFSNINSASRASQKKIDYKKVKTTFGPPLLPTKPPYWTPPLTPDHAHPTYAWEGSSYSILQGQKYVEECCKGQSTVKRFQQLWSNLVYSFKISMVFTYSLWSCL